MSLLEDADIAAADAHAGQLRRHGAPYIDHPRAVARLVDDVASACGIVIDDGVRAAALLHDVIEDSPRWPRERLAERFGAPVGDAVSHLTKSGKGEGAVVAYYQRLQSEGASTTKLIKVCDRLHNLSELHKAPSVQKLLEYVDETRRFVRPLAVATHPGLVAAVDDAIDNALRSQPQPNTMPPAAPTTGLYAIVHPTPGWQARLTAILDGGAARVQLRVKHAESDRAWLALIGEALALCRPRGVPLLVNDRADLAAAAGADGVHVGDTDLPPHLARRLVEALVTGRRALVGTSTHSLSQLRSVDRGVDGGAGSAGSAGGTVGNGPGADHIALGPIWDSPTKTGHADVVGVDVLRQACASTTTPIVAIGGITDPARAALAARAGAAFVAVVSALEPGPAPQAPPHSAGEIHLMARRLSLSFTAARASR